MVEPTLDVAGDSFANDSECEDEVDFVPSPWGWLFPQKGGYVAQNLVKDGYTFGRGEECDHQFESKNGRAKNPHYLALSNLHFRIYRERSKPTDTNFMVVLEDKSTNGTFVNGEKVGKNKKQVLNSDDEICLSHKTNRAFIFHDCERAAASTADLPLAFKEKYIMSKFLGRGACGEVMLAFEKGTCNKFAVKKISKKTFSVGPILTRTALEEVKIMKSIQHPCVVRIHDVFDTPTILYIVLELAEGGELFDRVVQEGRFSEKISKLYFYQLVMAIKYLHDLGITHRDIKPENILLASEGAETLIKVTDFGMSRFVGENSLMKTLCGTPSYLAPEVLESAGTRGYSKAVDLWSMGTILYIMLAGYPPFSSEITKYSLMDQITNARYSFPDKYWADVSGPAKDLIRRLLTLDPEQRITIAQALQHPWLCDLQMVASAGELMDAESATFHVSPSSPPPVPTGLKRLAEEELQCTSPPLNPAKRSNLGTSPPNTPNTPSPEDSGRDSPNGDAASTAAHSKHSTISPVSSI